MQNLETSVGVFDNLAALLSDPAKSAAVGAFFGAFIILIIALFLFQKRKAQQARVRKEMERNQRSLSETLTQKSRELDNSLVLCEQQKEELAYSKQQVARLEESTRKTPILEQQVLQQQKKIQELQQTIEDQIKVDNVTVQSLEAMISKEEAGEPVSMDAAADHLSMRFYLHLSNLHKRIAEQGRQIEKLGGRPSNISESTAHPASPRSRFLDLSRTSFSKQVVEPISMRVNGLKKTVQAIPMQARGKIDDLVVDPIVRRVNEIKAGINQIPAQSSAQINRLVTAPFNEFVETINRNIKDVTHNTQERYNHLVGEQLQNLIARIKASGLNLSREPLEYLNRYIIEPLQKLQKSGLDQNNTVKG